MTAVTAKQERPSRSDLIAMAKGGYGEVFVQSCPGGVIPDGPARAASAYLKSAAHNLHLSPANRMLTYRQAPEARGVMTFEAIKYKLHGSIRKGEKAAAHILAPKKNEKTGHVYFAPVPVFSLDQLREPPERPAPGDLKQIVGTDKMDDISARLQEAAAEIAEASGLDTAGGPAANSTVHAAAALMLCCRYGADAPALEESASRGLTVYVQGKQPTAGLASLAETLEAHVSLLHAAERCARAGDAVLGRIAEMQKDSPDLTVETAMQMPGEHGRSLLGDITLEVTGRAGPKTPVRTAAPAQHKPQKKQQAVR